jgi:hypothetical protein
MREPAGQVVDVRAAPVVRVGVLGLLDEPAVRHEGDDLLDRVAAQRLGQRVVDVVD